MDPFTDMLDALARNRITYEAIVRWLIEWAQYGADTNHLCRIRELGTTACSDAWATAHYLVYKLKILVPHIDCSNADPQINGVLDACKRGLGR